MIGALDQSPKFQPVFEQSEFHNRLKKICSINLLTGIIRLCCVIYIAVTIFLVIQGFELKNDNLFYQLTESAASHACMLFLSAFFLILLVLSNLYAVNSPMKPQTRSVFALVNISAFCVAALSTYYLHYNISSTII